MSGLVAAYELSKAGYNVQILEMSQRFGGRVKTLDQKDGFDRGLHVDGELATVLMLIAISCIYIAIIIGNYMCDTVKCKWCYAVSINPPHYL